MALALSCLRSAATLVLLPLCVIGIWLTKATEVTPGTARSAAVSRFLLGQLRVVVALAQVAQLDVDQRAFVGMPLGRAATAWRTLTMCRALARMARLIATCSATRMAPVLLRSRAERIGSDFHDGSS